ncbi:MAG: hypothetical protein ACI4E1_06465 [Lachnospira sp.]
MAKKGKVLKFALGVGAAAVAGKVAYDKFKATKEQFEQEENDSLELEVRKYNAIGTKKVVEIDDEDFNGCEVKAVGSKMVIDLGLAGINKDVYINFTSTASVVTIVVPDDVNVTCDIDRKASGVRNLVENIDDENVATVYVIGTATCSNIEIIPVNFYVDEEEEFEDCDIFEEEEPVKVSSDKEKADKDSVKDISNDGESDKEPVSEDDKTEE